MVIITTISQDLGCHWRERLWQLDKAGIRWEDKEASHAAISILSSSVSHPPWPFRNQVFGLLIFDLMVKIAGILVSPKLHEINGDDAREKFWDILPSFWEILAWFWRELCIPVYVVQLYYLDENIIILEINFDGIGKKNACGNFGWNLNKLIPIYHINSLNCTSDII